MSQRALRSSAEVDARLQTLREYVRDRAASPTNAVRIAYEIAEHLEWVLRGPDFDVIESVEQCAQLLQFENRRGAPITGENHGPGFKHHLRPKEGERPS